jgi:hypothetical protein
MDNFQGLPIPNRLIKLHIVAVLQRMIFYSVCRAG